MRREDPLEGLIYMGLVCFDTDFGSLVQAVKST